MSNSYYQQEFNKVSYQVSQKTWSKAVEVGFDVMKWVFGLFTTIFKTFMGK